MQYSNETFSVNYTYRTSESPGPYPYDVLALSVNSKLDSCVWDKTAAPSCGDNATMSFSTTCPPGAATEILTLPSMEQVPYANITYGVSCASANDMNQGLCGQSDCDVKTCYTNCIYCQQDFDLVFNVTVTNVTVADYCTLYMYYNMSNGGWCRLFPTRDNSCAGGTSAYTIVDVNPIIKYNVPVDTLETYEVKHLIAPTMYKWNVHCSSVMGESWAPADWVFSTRCPGQP
jgi:hypothetical protein